MKALNLKSIILAVGFIGLAGFSCYWTAESLFILFGNRQSPSLEPG